MLQGQQQGRAGQQIDQDGGQNQTGCSEIEGKLRPPRRWTTHQGPVEHHIEPNADDRKAKGCGAVAQGIKHAHQHVSAEIGGHAQSIGHQQARHELHGTLIESTPLVHQSHNWSGEGQKQGTQRKHRCRRQHQALTDSSDQLWTVLRSRQAREGWQQRQIHNSAYSHLKDVEMGKRKIVGVNHGMMEEEVPIKAMKLDDDLGEKQRNKLKSLRSSRDNSIVESSLEEIRNAAKNNTNLFPIVIKAIKNDCTLGEIMGAMKDEFGTWMAPSGF